jgi:hypothetical protein
MESDIYYVDRNKKTLHTVSLVLKNVSRTHLIEFSSVNSNKMSPNAYVSFTDGLLCGYPGEDEVELPVYTWTYSEFEEYLNESITPSMYRFMAEYVHDNISKEDLYQIQRDDYYPGDLNEEAVNAYFELPINQRIALHNQMLSDLKKKKKLAEAKEMAAIDALLEDQNPFGNDSPINHEYTEFMNGLVVKNRTKVDRLETQIHEEEQWRGGHEEGAEDF